jgi:hypothetical protein
MEEVYSGSEERSGEERSDDENQSESGEEETKESLEKAMVKTIQEFSVYTRAITKDLEDNENAEIEQAKKKGNNNKIKPIWKDSTFKIDFISGLLRTLLGPDRIIKYYITYVWPMKKYLKLRQPDFFLKNKRIYPGASEEDVEFFKALWTVKGAMTKSEKDTVWQFWDTLIEITEAWQEIVQWVRSDEDDMWIIDIDYNKAEENMKRDEEEISEDEEQMAKEREYMQGNFEKLHKEVSQGKLTNSPKATNSPKVNNNNSPKRTPNGKHIKKQQSSSDDDSD